MTFPRYHGGLQDMPDHEGNLAQEPDGPDAAGYLGRTPERLVTRTPSTRLVISLGLSGAGVSAHLWGLWSLRTVLPHPALPPGVLAGLAGTAILVAAAFSARARVRSRAGLLPAFAIAPLAGLCLQALALPFVPRAPLLAAMAPQAAILGVASLAILASRRLSS